MKKKAGVIAASVASIVMCSSVIAGSTFALFTSDSSTNIVVKSAKLKVDAKIKSAVSYESEINYDTLAVTYGETTAIEASGNTLTLENVKPGDKYGVQLEIAADASIDYKYRVSLAQTGDGELYENLLVGVDGVYYSDYVSSWENGADLGDGLINVEIIVPAYLTNKAMEKECNIEFRVEAVQGNATVSDADSHSHITHLVESAEKLVELFNGNKVAEGDTIALMTKIDEAEVTTSVKDFEIKGCDVGKITFNAPESTIDYLVNKTGTVVAEAVANESLHIYGAVTSALTVNSGRVVLMDGASVASATLAPEADNAAKLVVANKDKATVEEVVIAGEGTSVLENVELKNVEVADNSNFFAEDIESDTVTVYNAKSFYAALENEKYSTIILGDDIECPQYIFVERSVTIDGNNHTILSSADRIIRINTNDVELNLLNTKLLHTGKAERAVQVDGGIIGVKLNIDGCTAEATYYTINICNEAGVDLTVNNCELTGWGAINAWSANYKIHVTNSVLKGINDKPYNAAGWNGFGTIVVEGDTTGATAIGAESLELVFENCTIIAESLNGNIQKCMLFNSESNGNSVSFTDCNFVYGKDCVLYLDNGTNNKLSINAATVSDGDELVAALEDELCTEVILANDIAVTKGKSIVIDKLMTLDLNGHKLTMPKDATFTVKDGGKLLLKGGDLEITANAANNAVIFVEKDSTLDMDGVTLNTNGYGVFPRGNAAAVNIKNSAINSSDSIPVGTNAATEDNYDVVINVENSELVGASGMLVNIPCTVNIKDSVISGSMHGLIARGGNITVENSTISNTAEDGDLANYFNNRNWGDGNTVNLAGLTIGNKGGNAYQYPANVTLIDTKVTSTGYYPTVYMYGNSTEENCATLTYDNESVVGEVVYGGGITKVVVGGVVKLTVGVSTTEEAQAALDAATDNTTIVLKAGNYSELVLGQSAACSVNVSDNNYPKYSRTVNGLTIIGEDGAVVDGFSVATGHRYGTQDKPITNPITGETTTDTQHGAYYSTLHINNLKFENLTFTKSVKFGADSKNFLYVDGITLYNCRMNGMGAENTDGRNKLLDFGGSTPLAKNIVVENCTVTNAYQGVYTRGSRELTVRGCTFINLGHNAVAIQNNGSAAYTGEENNSGNVLVENNYMEDGKDRVFRIGDYWSGTITIKNNTIKNSGDSDGEILKYGSLNGGATLVFEGNTADGEEIVLNGNVAAK